MRTRQQLLAEADRILNSSLSGFNYQESHVKIAHANALMNLADRVEPGKPTTFQKSGIQDA